MNYFFLGVIAISTVFFCIETMRDLEAYDKYFDWIETAVVIIFTFEYALRFTCAPMPTLTFMLAPMHVIDLVAILPFYLEIAWRLYQRGMTLVGHGSSRMGGTRNKEIRYADVVKNSWWRTWLLFVKNYCQDRGLLVEFNHSARPFWRSVPAIARARGLG